ncbi:hypothetical protein ACFQX6_52280 [Streptosporangium lutulentum]
MPYAKPAFPAWSTQHHRPDAPAPYERADGPDLDREARAAALAETGEMTAIPASETAASVPEPAGKRTRHRHKMIKYSERHHHDWAWELIGFVIALAIAMLVFFAVPMIGTP